MLRVIRLPSFGVGSRTGSFLKRPRSHSLRFAEHLDPPVFGQASVEGCCVFMSKLKREDIGMGQKKAGGVQIRRAVGGFGIKRDQCGVIARGMGRKQIAV